MVRSVSAIAVRCASVTAGGSAGEQATSAKSATRPVVREAMDIALVERSSRTLDHVTCGYKTLRGEQVPRSRYALPVETTFYSCRPEPFGFAQGKLREGPALRRCPIRTTHLVLGFGQVSALSPLSKA